MNNGTKIAGVVFCTETQDNRLGGGGHTWIVTLSKAVRRYAPDDQ
jgi:hypothetical protein